MEHDESHVPLLPPKESEPNPKLQDTDVDSYGAKAQGFLVGFWPEAKRVLSLALPISLSEVVSYFAYLITTAQVGYLGALELSAITLARSVYHITGLSLVVGMSSGVETFCGQAFGAAHFGVLGLVLQRAALLCLATCVGPWVLWGRGAEQLMRAMGQQPEVVVPAARFLRLLGPSLAAWGLCACIKSYLTSQGVVKPLTVVAFTYTALTPLVNHLFMFQLRMGMMGAAVAYNVLQVFELLLLVCSMVWLHVRRQGPGRHTWRGFSTQAFRGWGTYLKVALPSAAAICFDWWTYEAVILIAGLLPDAHVQLGAMGLAFNTHGLLFMVVGGFSSAASTRVANELGAGRGGAARHALCVVLALGALAPLAASGGLLAAPAAWARLYTPDTGIIRLVCRLMPVLTLSNVADSVATVCSGALRGSGRQGLAFATNLVVYWLLGLPCAALLALRYRMDAMGLWVAMAGAAALQALILLGCLLRFDWPAETRRALRRVAESEGAAQAAAAAAAAAGSGATTAVGGALPATADAAEEPAAEDEEAAMPPPPPPPLHGGLDSRHGVHEPLLTAEHVM
ncbi:hypothetical protein Agub_g9868 [Astrephomene gubernaculifera]|uniref:Protein DETOXIFICATION n=1 Tax=Astrephomene gubernaculifera TaxID=47775 RepID=A0AAD3HPD0_9CHLO|nr:hypothetical protein Agub_g9868 [Astrephomene gubernaculifera]